MKTILAGLLTLLIAADCFGGPVFFEALVKELESAARKKWYKPWAKVAAGRREEAEQLLFDSAQADKIVGQIHEQNPELAKSIERLIISGQDAYTLKLLSGFTTKDFTFTLKETATTPLQQALQGLAKQKVADIANELAAKTSSNLPRKFFYGPTKSQVDSSLQDAIAEHKPVMGEHITYNRLSSQLVFEFNATHGVLDRAVTDFGPPINRCLTDINQKRLDLHLSPAP